MGAARRPRHENRVASCGRRRTGYGKAETDKMFPGITATINQDMADVEALGVNQTPTFFLQGKKLEIVSAEKFFEDVRLAVEGA